MAQNPLLDDLRRALDLLSQVDESSLDFPPDPNVSADIRDLTGLSAYPVDSHRDNMKNVAATISTLTTRLPFLHSANGGRVG